MLINILGLILIIRWIKTPNDLWICILIQTLTIFLSQSFVSFLFDKITIGRVKLSDLMRHLNLLLFILFLKFQLLYIRILTKLLLEVLSSKSDIGFYINAVV